MIENKKLEYGYFINIAFSIIIGIASLYFMTADVSSYITKTTASVLFVLCGVVNLLYCLKAKALGNLKFMIFMVIGLFFAMLGDVLLIDYFVIGAALFAVGHVFYFIAFCFIAKFKLRDIIAFLIIFVPALLLILLYPKFEFGGMQALVIVYALIISLMLGKAISNIFGKSNRLVNIIIALGALMFFLSDLMLLFNVFANMPYIYDITCIALYYPAEFVLAFTVFLVGFKYNNSDDKKIAKTE